MDKRIKALEAKFNQKAYNLATTINEIVRKSLEDEDVYDTDLETNKFVNELVREAVRIAEDRRINEPIAYSHSDALIEKSLKIGDSKSLLLMRLKDALSCLHSVRKNIFKGYTYDFENKRLVSPCKKYALQWQLRSEPDKPISPHNQQTSCGIVVVVEL